MLESDARFTICGKKKWSVMKIARDLNIPRGAVLRWRNEKNFVDKPRNIKTFNEKDEKNYFVMHQKEIQFVLLPKVVVCLMVNS